MSDFVEVPPQSTGEKISVVQLADGAGNNVDLQRIIHSDPVSFGKDARSAPRLTYHAVAQATTNAVCIKASSAIVYGADIFNNTDYPVFVKLYNKATPPNPASDSPLRVIGVQAGERAYFEIDCGLDGFSVGLGIAIVKGISDSDATAVAANDCIADLFYL